MFNPERPNFFPGEGPEKNEEEYKQKERIEVSTSESLPEINIDEKDVLESKKRIDETLGKEWDLSNEEIQIGLFTSRREMEDFAQEKNIPPEKLSKDSALFYIDPNTQEKYVFVAKDFEKAKKMFESMDYSEDEALDFLRRGTLAGISHEMTHMHPFFEKHGNQETDNLWEQEMICNYLENKAKGDTSEMLAEWGYIDDKKIEEFTLEHGEWGTFSKEEKNAVIDYFYPFLVKEYGLDNTREIWKRLQINSDISVAMREVLEVDPQRVVTDFKKKIKDREYLKNVLD